MNNFTLINLETENTDKYAEWEEKIPNFKNIKEKKRWWDSSRLKEIKEKWNQMHHVNLDYILVPS